MNWETLQKMKQPTERQIKVYCKKHNYDYESIFEHYEDYSLMKQILSEIEKNNLAKKGIKIKIRRQLQ